MTTDTMTAKELFQKAYDYHYDEKAFPVARFLYLKVISDFPNSKEAEYAKSQLSNIDNSEAKSTTPHAGEAIAPEDFFHGHIPESCLSTEEFDHRVSRIILTTAQQIDGFKVDKTIEIISSECVLGINIFDDMLASITDVFGGRSKGTQNMLRQARKTCLDELRKDAASLGADAVIAVDLDYSEFTGKGKSMLFLVASGTAVTLRSVECN